MNGSGGTVSPPPADTTSTPADPLHRPPPPTTNTAPTASFSFQLQKGNCTFDGSASRDDSGNLSYQWSFGDGATAATSASYASHVYTQKGNYTVTAVLWVTDAAGLTGGYQKSFSIKNNGR